MSNTVGMQFNLYVNENGKKFATIKQILGKNLCNHFSKLNTNINKGNLMKIMKLHKHSVEHSMEKRKIYFHTKKYRQINYFLLVKPLLSRNFCQTRVIANLLIILLIWVSVVTVFLRNGCTNRYEKLQTYSTHSENCTISFWGQSKHPSRLHGQNLLLQGKCPFVRICPFVQICPFVRICPFV